MALPIISQITSSILRTTRWDVQVLKSQKIQPESDDLLIKAKQFISGAIDWATSAVQNTMESFFGGQSDKKKELYETIGEFDTFVSFNGVRDSQVVQNAIESGAFRSVNKIRKPNTCIVELARGGTESEIELTLKLLNRYQGGIYTMRVLTPFGYMDNLNLVKFEHQYKRGDGARMLIARLHFQEIMYGNASQYTTKKVSTPDKTNTTSGGQVAAQGGK